MPVDRGNLDAQLREIGESERWWEHPEFRELPHVLHPGERILGLVSGMLLGPPRPRLIPRAPWLFVATDQRIVCLKQERGGRRQIDIPPGQITGVLQRSRTRSFLITIETPLHRHRIRIAKEDAYRFTTVLARLVPQLREATPATAATPPVAAAGMIGAGGADGEVRAQVAGLRGEVERLERRVARLEERLAAEADRTEVPSYGASGGPRTGT